MGWARVYATERGTWVKRKEWAWRRHEFRIDDHGELWCVQNTACLSRRTHGSSRGEYYRRLLCGRTTMPEPSNIQSPGRRNSEEKCP
ncbi:hypothetical protein PV325_012295, partial [Microctonus aethiopoides]